MSTGVSIGSGVTAQIAGAERHRIHRARGGSRRGPRLIAVAALVLVAAGAVVGVVLFLPAGDGGHVMTADRVAARKAAFDITTTANGELEAKNQKEIRNELETQSTIADIIAEGTFAKKGDLLVKLNSEKIETQVNDESLMVRSAEAEAATAEAGFKIQESENRSKIRQAELKVALAELALEQWRKGDVEKKNQEMALALEKADRDVTRLEEKYKRSSELFEKKFLSKNDYELDYIALLEAKAALKKARLEELTYREYQHPKDQKTKESDLAEARAELDRVQFNAEKELASKKAALDKAREQLRIRTDRLEKYQRQMAKCTITAESEGLVVYATSMERNRFGWGGDGPLQIGREVYPNMLLMVLPDTSEMVASVKVPESLAGRIRPGLSATVKVDAAGGRTFRGTVDSIGVLAESGGWRDPNLREYTVKISLSDVEAGAGLKPSMRCEAQIVLGHVDDALSVPVQAVFSDSGVRFVYRAESGRFVRQPVNLGRRSETSAEIIAGLKEGDLVLLREPGAGEILSQPWDKAQLALAGYTLGDDGLPLSKDAAADIPAPRADKARPPGGPGPDADRSGPRRPRRAEGKTDGKTEGKADTKAELKADGKTEVKTEGKTQVPAGTKTEAAAPAPAPAKGGGPG